MCFQVEMLRCELRKSIRLVWLCVQDVDVQNMVGLIHLSIEMLIYKIIWLVWYTWDVDIQDHMVGLVHLRCWYARSSGSFGGLVLKWVAQAPGWALRMQMDKGGWSESLKMGVSNVMVVWLYFTNFHSSSLNTKQKWGYIMKSLLGKFVSKHGFSSQKSNREAGNSLVELGCCVALERCWWYNDVGKEGKRC